ncbi:GNAT family N-acetyltransferase [Actinoplanes sp. NPDC049668]|uniref:GNAT family N-acetyltransferase n=1 Tax=unclassified Actinoplanes TaxID=2626549 RepID=UPI0033AEA059
MAQTIFRTATRADVPAILDLLADDDVTRARDAAAHGTPAVPEETDAACWAAFEAIDADQRNELIVAEQAGAVVGTCQLTFIPSLSRRGAERMTIEAVRVRADLRGHGVGRAMMRWSLDRARERGCGLAQLTTDKRRTDAHRFYADLGFEASHEGFKLRL